MKRIHILVIKSYLGPFVLTFLVVVFLLLMQFLWKYIDDLVGKGLEFKVLAELLLYTSASLVPMALPLATMLASIMTFGDLGENNELIAMKSAGISLQRIFMPLVIISILVSIGAFFFANNVLPYTNLKMRSLLYDVQRQRPELNIKPGIFYNGIEGYSIKIADKDPKTNVMRKIIVYDHTEKKGNTYVIRADSGYMKVTPDKSNLIMTMYHGYSYYEDMDRDKKRRRSRTYPHRRDRFEQQTLIIELTGFGLVRSDEGLFKKSYQMMNIVQLEQITDSLNKVLKEKEAEFKKGFFNDYLFNKSYRWRIDQMKKDKPPTMDIHFSIDSAYHKLTPHEQLAVVRSAINQSRAAKNFISTGRLNIEGRDKRIKKYDIEWHLKFTLSVACLIFFFIGAPLGAVVRKGGFGMSAIFSTLFFVLYYIISTIGKKAAVEGVFSVASGVWLSTILVLPLGIFLTYKATTDSMILNMEYYVKIQKKLMVFLGMEDIDWTPDDRLKDENTLADK